MGMISKAEMEIFAAAYVNPESERNPGKAYEMAFPYKNLNRAMDRGKSLLARPTVQLMISEFIETSVEEKIADRDYLIKEAHEIGQEARKDGKLQIALNAVEQKAKLNKLYEVKGEGLEGYRNLLQSLIINGDVNIVSGG